MAVEQKVHRKGPASDEIGARISLRDAAELPEGAWVCTNTGLLYEAEDSQSLVAVVSDEHQEFILVGTPGKTAYPQMRQRAREHGVEPKF